MDNREEQGAAVLDSIEAVLRPLMPLFRNFGVTHHDLSQMLARLFVYDTAEILQSEGQPTTDARLALMTGLTRGEAEKYLAERASAVKRRSVKSNALMTPAAVLTAWNTDQRFSTPYGAALDLSLGQTDRQRSFSDLVAMSAPGADPDAILDQLVAAGCVEVHEENFVRCTNRAYIPAGVSVERITRMGAALGALARTVTHNLLVDSTDSISYTERSVTSDFPVSLEGRRAIHAWLVSDGTRFLETLDAWMNTSRKNLEAPNGHGVGVEFFMFDAPSEATPSPDVASKISH